MKMFQQIFKQEWRKFLKHSSKQAQKWECHNWCNKGMKRKTKILQNKKESDEGKVHHETS